MISTKQNRLDPSNLDPGELEQLVGLLSRTGTPALVDEAGNRINLPEPVYRQLLRVLRMMQEGRAIVMLPEDETFTTQAAANYLGVSRQHLVNLTESQEIPCHKVGTHRRIYFKDLLDYDKRRNAERRTTLKGLAAKVDQEGFFEADYTGDEE